MRYLPYFIAILVWMCAGVSKAQELKEIRFVTRGESIAEALKLIVENYDIDLVYDPEMDLSGKVYVDIKTEKAGDALTEVLKRSRFDYLILSTGTYVIVEKKEIEKTYGSFFGYVYDQETGEPIENATIFLADASNSTVTNDKGYFSVSPLLKGEYPVIISSVGYAPMQEKANIQGEDELRIIRLQPTVFVGDPIIVEAETPALSMNKLFESSDLSALKELVALNPTAMIRSMNLFAGVSFNYAQNYVSIQGSNPSNFNIQLDGVPLYNTQRAASLLGMFSPQAIGKIKLFKAGMDQPFPTTSGNIIDFTQVMADRSNTTNYLIQADPNAVNARAEFSTAGGVFKTAATFRTKVPGMQAPWGFEQSFKNWNRFDPLIQNFLMGNDQDIAHYHEAVQRSNLSFSDVHVASEYSPNEYQKTSLSGYFGNEHLGSRLLSERGTMGSEQPVYVYSNERTETDNLMLKVAHYRVVNATTDIDISTSFTASNYRYYYLMQTDNLMAEHGVSAVQAFATLDGAFDNNPELTDQNTLSDLRVNAKLVKYLSSRQKLNAGVSASFMSHEFQLNDLFYFPIQNKEGVRLVNAFVRHEFTPNRLVRFSYSLHTMHSNVDDEWYLMPRLSFNVDTEKTAIGYQSISLKAGLYRDFFGQFDITNIGPSALTPFNRITVPFDDSITPPVSYQAGLEWSVKPAINTTFKLEGYYKWEPNNYELNFAQLLQTPVINSQIYQNQSQFLEERAARSYGVSLIADHIFEESKVSVTLIQQSNISRFQNNRRFNGEWNHTSWSEPFSSSGLVAWQATSRLSVSGNYKWIPTRYWVYTRSYYDFLTTHQEHTFGEFSVNDPDSESLRAYFQLDAGISYRLPVKNSELKFRLDLQNLTNRANEISYLLTPQIAPNGGVIYTRSARTLPGFIPFISVQLEF